MIAALSAGRAFAAGLALGLAVAGVGTVSAYLTGRDHAANKAAAKTVTALVDAAHLNDELRQRRAQIEGQWAAAGYRVGRQRAAADQDEAARQGALRRDAYENASDPLRADWPVPDQRRLACVLDPACGGDARQESARPGGPR